MAERRDTRVVAGVGVLLFIDDTPEPCMTRNLSRGGMFVVTKRMVGAGAIVGLEVVHKGKRLKAKAQVIKCTDDGLGLSFIGVDEEFRAAIRNVMDQMVAERMTPADEEEGAPDRAVNVQAFWAFPGTDKWWQLLKKKRFSAELTNLTLDGASMRSKTMPEVNDTLFFYLDSNEVEMGGPVHSEAKVVRFTENGFAVRFQNPSIEFRRAVSTARRSKFGRR